MIRTTPLYARQVAKAQSAGIRLGQYLSRLTGPMLQGSEIVLVAHSLGCRVALEAVRQFEGASGAQRRRIRALLLMAAAVPTYMVGGGGRLAAAARLAAKTYVLYSRKDLILRWFFPPGQTMAGEGRLPQAVGRHGRPATVWSGRDETMLGHSDYWAGDVTTPHAARLFGLDTGEELPSFALLDWPSVSDRNLPTSSLPTR